MKKILNILVAVIAVFACSFAVKAASGTITINRDATNSNYATTYKAYKILDLKKSNNSYSYSAVSAKWEEFLESSECFTVVTDKYGNTPTTSAGRKYYKSVLATSEYPALDNDKSVVAGCAKAALEYAKENNISPTSSVSVSSGSTTAEITGLSLGYYLVDSTLGAICNLTTYDTDVAINEKNAEPTITKKVNGVATADAKIGDTVNYKVTITVAKGYENYILKDSKAAGLTYTGDITVKYYKNRVATGDGLTQVISTSDSEFSIDFTNTDLSDIDEIEISYSAKVNKNAVSGPQINTATLEFGYKDPDNNTAVNSATAKAEVDTHIAKFTKVDKDENPLTGAKFKLYDVVDGAEVEIKLVLENGYYRVAEAGEVADAVEYIEAGFVIIKGLDNKTYKLEEVEAPEGYTKLGAKLDLEANDPEDSAATKVYNTTGVVLPSTGGIGTKLFMIFGSLMVVVFGTLLVTKFRFAKQN